MIFKKSNENSRMKNSEKRLSIVMSAALVKWRNSHNSFSLLRFTSEKKIRLLISNILILVLLSSFFINNASAGSWRKSKWQYESYTGSWRGHYNACKSRGKICRAYFTGKTNSNEMREFKVESWSGGSGESPCTSDDSSRNIYDCQNKNSGTPKQCSGNPINTLTGYKYQLMDSEVKLNNNYIWPIYYHWNTEFTTLRTVADRKIVVFNSFENGPLEGVIHREDGSEIGFLGSLTEGWTVDPDVNFELTSDASTGSIMWELKTIEGKSEFYNSNGNLISVYYKNGQEILSFHYDLSVPNGGDNDPSTLDKVEDNRGNYLYFSYSASSLLDSISNSDGLFSSYIYDSSNRLIATTYASNGGTRIYHYEDTNFPNALTGITDEKGIRFATWAYDAEGRAISSEHHGSAEKVTLDYTHIDDSVDPKVTATNALGKQTTYRFTTIYGARKVTQVEGHQATNCAAANKSYTYDANGFLASKTDWLGNLTNYIRNAKGQELTRTEAVGTPDERLFTTEWHPTLNLPTKITSSDYELIYFYDSNGNLLSTQRNDLTP
ncbi:RHS repeat protein [bacterium SCSIO 12696]|nr:RHS repeat protein [bacterium SCSIO 12696]